MAQVLMYTKASCPFCIRAKALLSQKGVFFEEILIDGRDDLRENMIQRSQQKTVPQIWIGNQHIGGFDDLYALESVKKLDKLLEPSKQEKS